jgi:PAS domain S-box-containing protein
MREGLVIADRHGNILDVNPAALACQGLETREEATHNVRDYPPDMLRDLSGRILPYEEWPLLRILRGEHISDMEVRVKLGPDREVIHRYNGAAIRNESGETILAVLTFRDVTERKRIEWERERDRWSLAVAQKAGHAASFDWDLKKDVLTTCNGIDELYGLRPGHEMKSTRDWLGYVAPEDRERAQLAAEDARRTGELNAEWRIIRRDSGEVRWIDARGKVFFDEDGNPVRFIGVNQDITERKAAEESIAALTRHLEAHLGNTPLAVVEFSPEFRITRWSGESESLFGYSASEAVGKTFEELDLVHKKDLPKVKAEVEDLLNRGECRLLLQSRNCRKDRTQGL